MVHVRARVILATMVAAVLVSTCASAQVFGTFSWQMQPYCNVGLSDSTQAMWQQHLVLPSEA